ncbi:MAG TPA: D-alanine--D-alanine ligase family protein [Cyclobacteriaceae bacterium]|nr:D-alanine--D-alanine ligase family protein [Cyclobacteriaceae bacterium]HRJ83178.1 D-alanine--D-alanine ligase family protein [Cyclobacteriaceae bacterium]
MTVKKKVALLYGGRSVEHGVSVNSGRNIFEFIDKENFEVIPIGISQTGQWFLTQGVTKDVEQGKALGLILDPKNAGLILLASGDRIKVDLVFPVLHGTDGEDGSIQGLIKALDIPMVGTGVLGSSVSMNKVIAKKMLKEAGVPVSKFLTYSYRDKKKINFEEIVKKLKLPFMVKSACLGSSVGVSKVSKKTEFKKALEEAFRYDHEVIIEEFITGREIECAIMGNTPAIASNPGEIIINKNYEFYTFDAKYVDPDAVKIEVPANVDKASSKTIREVSLKAYETLRCEDFARVDLFLTKKGKIYVNEINTIPGFTNSSMFPMMWKEKGISFTELITKLITLALERFAENKRIERGYESSLKF